MDLLDADEAKQKAQAIVEALGWEGDYYMIAAINQEGVKKLCWDIMEFLKVTPREQDIATALAAEEKVDLCGMTTIKNNLKILTLKTMTKIGMKKMMMV
ncbi:GTPase ObgE [Proteus mirabilis]|uniref:GTPase ObgE n=1 Tax=Proteus mirabilis TaxID=584 RepID=A0A379FF57_PROMI|nr:GTPase ObgE [Proteus mirabilis]